MRLVVIGGVAAGLSAASRARRLDRSLEILVLEKGQHISYAACGLPYYLEGHVRRPEDLVVHNADFFRREREIEIRTGAEVAAIAPMRREVQLRSGERIVYDKLVVATGAQPVTGGVPGAFTLHTIEDARKLREFLDQKRPRRAAVVGAGYIGLELAEALRSNGLDVAVYESSENVLNRHDAGLTALVGKHLERCRVELKLNARFDGGGSYDLVVSAAGLLPNVMLAFGAGIELGATGAIRVNERMETNVAGIYAAGDCAEMRHLVTGRMVWVPLGSTANKMGRVAGANAAGKRARFQGIAGTSIVRVCGLAVATTGLSLEMARREGFDAVSERIEAHDRARYFWTSRPTTVELVAERRSGRLLGGTVLGDADVAGRINVVASALAHRMLVDEFQYLDLAYSPPYAPVWDPLLVCAQQLEKKLG